MRKHFLENSESGIASLAPDAGCEEMGLYPAELEKNWVHGETSVQDAGHECGADHSLSWGG